MDNLFRKCTSVSVCVYSRANTNADPLNSFQRLSSALLRTEAKLWLTFHFFAISTGHKWKIGQQSVDRPWPSMGCSTNMITIPRRRNIGYFNKIGWLEERTSCSSFIKAETFKWMYNDICRPCYNTGETAECEILSKAETVIQYIQPPAISFTKMAYWQIGNRNRFHEREKSWISTRICHPLLNYSHL